MKKNNFSHLLKKNDNTNLKSMSKNTELLTSFIFLFFLLLFVQYAPFEQHQVRSDSIFKMFFQFYFFVSNQTLGMVHEAGHGVCYILPCPRFMMVINGTLFQVGFPLGIAYYYKNKMNAFGTYIALFFTGFSLQYTAWYISTSHEGSHVSAAKSFLGVDGYHDFNYILNIFGLLPYDSLISTMVKTFAYMLMFYAVIKMFVRAFSHKS